MGRYEQPGMDGDVGILSLGAQLVFWSPEFDRVLLVPTQRSASASRSRSPRSPLPGIGVSSQWKSTLIIFTHPILPLGAAFVVEEFFYRIERLLGILSRIQIGNKIGKSKIGVRMVDIVLEKCAILTISGDTYGDRLDKTSAVSLLQRILRISAHALKYCECRLCGMRKIDTTRNQRE